MLLLLFALAAHAETITFDTGVAGSGCKSGVCKLLLRDQSLTLENATPAKAVWQHYDETLDVTLALAVRKEKAGTFVDLGVGRGKWILDASTVGNWTMLTHVSLCGVDPKTAKILQVETPNLALQAGFQNFRVK